MNEKRINIKFLSTFIHSNYSRELVFYYLTEVEENTHPIWYDWDGTDFLDRIEIHNYNDVLPDDGSVLK